MDRLEDEYDNIKIYMLCRNEKKLLDRFSLYDVKDARENTDSNIKYIIQDDIFEKAVYKIREAKEDFNMTKSAELLDSVSEDLRTLERLLIKDWYE